MKQIFISYSRRDTEIVDQIAGQMKDAGLDVWVDREAIKAGDTWRLQIVEAIDTCLAFVLMLSPNSATSDNVRREIDLAQDIENPFLPLMLEPIKIPPEIRYQLAGQQIIDVQMLGFEKAVSQLINTIQEHIRQYQPAAEQDTRQIELVIQGINLKDLTTEKQEQLLDFLAELSNSDRSKLQLAGLASGSVHAFVNMSSKSAYQLKTMALNRDGRFMQQGISALRLDGEARYINIALGIFTLSATLSLLQIIRYKISSLLRSKLGTTPGKFLTIILAVFIFAGAGFAAAQYFNEPVSLPVPTVSSTATQKTILSPTQTPQPTATLTLPAPSPTTTLTLPAPSPTTTSKPTTMPTYRVLRGKVQLETDDRTLACRYGPGDMYLFKYSLKNRATVEVGGQMEIHNGDQKSIWLYLIEGYQEPCWINSKYIQLDGEIANLEPAYYPDKAKMKLVLYKTNLFNAPDVVTVTRSGNQVEIKWSGASTLEPGDRESGQSPLYLVETWTCQDGKIVFTPIGAFAENVSIKDEPGCSESSSHGQVYLAHKDGYIGPVEFPWPIYSTPTP